MENDTKLEMSLKNNIEIVPSETTFHLERKYYTRISLKITNASTHLIDLNNISY